MQRNDIKPPSELLVVGNVYHRVSNEQPEAIPIKFKRTLQSDEQLFKRRLKIDGNKELNLGWIEKPGLLVIENLAGTTLQKIPTEEEKEEISKQILYICLSQYPSTFINILKILPGESYPIPLNYGSTFNKYFLRTDGKSFNINLYVIPE